MFGASKMRPYSILCCSDMLVGTKVCSCQVDVVEVVLEPEGQCAFGLSNILFETTFARDAVNDVGAFAAHIKFTSVGKLCDRTFDGPTSI